MRAPFVKIALSGSAGAGKDFIAEALAREYLVRPLSFATPMKKAAGDVLGLTIAEVEAIKADKTHPKHHAMRYVLQHIGTNVFREGWDENVWVENLLRRAADVEVGGLAGGVAITDCRFRNEFEALRAAGYLMVDVQAPPELLRLARPPEWAVRLNAVRYLRRFVPKKYRPALHPSERDLDAFRVAGSFDLVVMNDRTMDGPTLARLVAMAAESKAWLDAPSAEVSA